MDEEPEEKEKEAGADEDEEAAVRDSSPASPTHSGAWMRNIANCIDGGAMLMFTLQLFSIPNSCLN